MGPCSRGGAPGASRISSRLLLLLTLLPLVLGQETDTTTTIPAQEEDSEEWDSDSDCIEDSVECGDLQSGQFLCLLPEIDSETQQPKDCQLVNGTGLAPIQCKAITGIVCSSTCNQTFTRYEECKWTNGYQFDTALLLSVFLGMFGADRFYLGYPAIGLLKFSTLGFFFLGHLVDVILIASQALGPADGSHYVINYFGAGLTRVSVSEDTYRREQADWF